MNLLAAILPLTVLAPGGMHTGKPAGVRNKATGWALHLTAAKPRLSYRSTRLPTAGVAVQKRPLLTHRDVVAYHWKTHRLTLTAAARKRLRKRWVKLVGHGFIVMARGKRLYAGLVYSSIFSYSRKVPVLLPTRTGVRIERAYPTAAYAVGVDPRNRSTVRRIFKRLGRLR